jgi:DNA-binding response OmpR family regulator
VPVKRNEPPIVKIPALISTADAALIRALQAGLAAFDFDLTVCADPPELARRLGHVKPELLVLDAAGPPPGGLAMCAQLRHECATADLAIVMIAASAQPSERIAALDAGADDCLARPLNTNELAARIRALRRRLRRAAVKGQLRAGPIHMDLDRWIVRLDGQPVELTKMEFRLLQALLEAHGRALTRDALLRRISPHTAVHGLVTRTVDVHIGRLRRKLGKSGKRIITVRNVGFRFDIVPEWLSTGTGVPFDSSDPRT